MADIGNNLKSIWMKGMAAIGNTASSIANNTKFKVDEMSMVTRRAEILKDFGAKAYALWQKGEHFPEELEEQLRELSGLDEKLNDMRAERIAGIRAKKDAAVETPEETEDSAEEEYEENAEEYAEDGDIPEEEAESGADESAEADPEDGEDSVPVIRVEGAEEPEKDETPLSSAISDLFDQVPSAEEAAEKVNSAIDSLEDGLKEISDTIDGAVDDLAEKIGGEEKE